MTLKPAQVRKLLSAAELALYEASQAGVLRALTGAQLRIKLSRARVLRDKYQDLIRRQKVATRIRTGSKSGPVGFSNQRTEDKVSVLTEVLRSFETRLAQLEPTDATKADKVTESGPKGQPRSSKASIPKKNPGAVLRELMNKKLTQTTQAKSAKSTRSVKAPAPVPVSDNSSGQPGRTAPPGGTRRLMRSGQAQIQGHSAAQVRRTQAKRDSRG